MRPGDRADDIKSVVYVRDPIAHRLVERVFERARAAFDRAHFGPQQFHPPDIRRLADDIRRAHIHHARQPGARRHRRRRDAVLAGAGFGDDAPLAHPLREQNLPGGVVDFVRAGVIQVFAF